VWAELTSVSSLWADGNAFTATQLINLRKHPKQAQAPSFKESPKTLSNQIYSSIF
jgi:hypothetical protein